MREANSPPPAMSHSPAYYQQYRSSNSSSPAHRQSQALRRPPPAHLEPQQAHLPNADHLKSSISSATSGSTDATDQRDYTCTQTYPRASEAERGQLPDPRGRSSQLSPTASHRASNGHHSHREMVQASPPTVIRYIQEDVDEEDEEETPDHAIWILVCDCH